MEWTVIDGFSDKDTERFRNSCNNLLGRTFVSRILWDNGEKKHNPDYSFLAQYQQIVHGYLSFLGWELFHEQYNGYFYIINNLEENRLAMDKESTGILLALRLIYDEDSERAGLNHDVVCYVRDLLEKTVVNFSILRQKPNMRELSKHLQLLEKHNIVARLDGRFNEVDCRFAILPTILTAVSAEKTNALVEQMKKLEETANEETDENTFD